MERVEEDEEWRDQGLKALLSLWANLDEAERRDADAKPLLYRPEADGVAILPSPHGSVGELSFEHLCALHVMERPSNGHLNAINFLLKRYRIIDKVGDHDSSKCLLSLQTDGRRPSVHS